jgi:tyrosyl-tRNA synthetase
MSKSKGNYVGILEPPDVMVKKLMTISDDLMWRYFELLTDLPVAEIGALKHSGRNPRDIKLDLARRIVADFHGAATAQSARDQWLHDVSQGQIPETLEEVSVSDPRLNKALVQAGLAPSGAEADRLIKSGAVELFAAGNSSLPVGAPTQKLEPGRYAVRAGKRWKRIVV